MNHIRKSISLKNISLKGVFRSLVVLCLFSMFSFTAQPPKVGVVNFKTCVEKSTLGKDEQARFEEMKTSFEKSMEAKEKEISALSPKFSEEYLDTLTPQAENELKEAYRKLNLELNQMQEKYYNMLNHANYQILQKLGESIQKASEKICREKGLDFAINQDACFYFNSSYDISSEVITEMDKQFIQAQKEPPSKK